MAKEAKKETVVKTKPKKTAAHNAKKQDDFYVVGMGASAGGLESFESFFKHMPSDSGIAFILVPHLDPTHISIMPELIQKCSKMKVVQAEDGLEVKPDSVYIVPPNHNLAILNNTLQLMEIQSTTGLRMPIDYFFRSLADDKGDKGICIILSGMGTDGTLGLRAVKGRLGMAMVQSPDSAKYDSMPRSAIDTQFADYILPPEKMPQQLMTYTKHAVKKINLPDVLLDDEKVPNALQKIFVMLRDRTGHDFSDYKQNTICRRIERRMNVQQVGKIETYLRLLRENPAEIDMLFQDLLIGVTNFFRDPEAFENLKTKGLPAILGDRPQDYQMRVWVPGCASGEEAYSVAILLREAVEKLSRHIGVQVFATDIDQNAIETARAGVYPASIAADVSKERLSRFFMPKENSYIIRKDIREMLVFASQDIINDPPFTKLDLICCRNLLIYLNGNLQKKLLPLFHYGLKPGGILFLGSSETIGNFTDLFTPVDKKWKIYQKKGQGPRVPAVAAFPTVSQAGAGHKTAASEPSEDRMAQTVEKLLLADYAPPCVIVNTKGHILYIHGRTGRYLEPAQGAANLNIFEMAREGLKSELPVAIHKAFHSKKTVTYEELQVQYNGGHNLINLTVKPLDRPEAGADLLLVVFEDIRKQPQKEKGSARGGPKQLADKRIATLEKELQRTRENLQTTIEELETSNEELNSTNEELQSTNEELQSSNEELETSKEEQQSLNEELTTLNAELQGKIDALTSVNNDMKNLLDSIEVPTIFLDNALCIKRFTKHAVKLINLRKTDIGRPITELVSKLENVDIAEDAEAVLKDLAFREREITTQSGDWYLMRTLPYRTVENVIDGVVLTFMDLTQTKIAEQKRRLATIVTDSNDAITVQDFNGNILDWNRGAERMYGYSEAEAKKMNISKLLPENKEKEGKKLLAMVKRGDYIRSFRTRRKTKSGAILDVWLTITELTDDKGLPVAVATTERDLAWLPKPPPDETG